MKRHFSLTFFSSILTFRPVYALAGKIVLMHTTFLSIGCTQQGQHHEHAPRRKHFFRSVMFLLLCYFKQSGFAQELCFYCPSRYRTQICNDGLKCKRKICFFAHKIDELRTPPHKPGFPADFHKGKKHGRSRSSGTSAYI